MSIISKRILVFWDFAWSIADPRGFRGKFDEKGSLSGVKTLFTQSCEILENQNFFLMRRELQWIISFA